jgi:hypothetical protein
MFEDWELIEASFAQQYGIRLRYEDDMEWTEFSSLLAGLNGETPLGHVVSIRSEKDPKVKKRFTPEQKRIYNAWRRRSALKGGSDEYMSQMQSLKSMFMGLAK